jgi:hypothetical protein
MNSETLLANTSVLINMLVTSQEKVEESKFRFPQNVHNMKYLWINFSLNVLQLLTSIEYSHLL